MLYKRPNPHGGDVYLNDIELDFSASINPLGTPDAVKDAVRTAAERLDRYPDPYCGALVRALAQAHGLPAEYVLCGNGAAELIYSFCDAVRPAAAVETAPTFGEYAQALQKHRCRIARYPLRAETGFLPDEGLAGFVAAEDPDVLFLCNPNNPTGRLMPMKLMKELLALCARRNIRVFMDECFLDLATGGESLAGLLREYPCLIILKAFTKTYAVPGLRLGYCLSADPALLGRMAGTVQPWNVSVPAQAAGIAALGEREYADRSRQYIAAGRAQQIAGLRALGFEVCPSEANFILFRGPVGLDKKLLSQRIAVRNCANFPGLSEGWYRIAVRTEEENDRLIAALKSITNGQRA